MRLEGAAVMRSDLGFELQREGLTGTGSVAPHGYEVGDFAVTVVAGLVRPTWLYAGQTLEARLCRGPLDFLREWPSVAAIADGFARMAEVSGVRLGREAPWRTAASGVFAQRPLEANQSALVLGQEAAHALGPSGACLWWQGAEELHSGQPWDSIGRSEIDI